MYSKKDSTNASKRDFALDQEDLDFFYRFILMLSQMPLSQKGKEGPYLDLVCLALRLGVCGNPMNPPDFGKH